MSLQSGIELIAQERALHQYGGYTDEHDDAHVDGEMAIAAIQRLTLRAWIPCRSDASEKRVKDLVIAGSLIAAEIDRILRLRAASHAEAAPEPAQEPRPLAIEDLKPGMVLRQPETGVHLETIICVERIDEGRVHGHWMVFDGGVLVRTSECEITSPWVAGYSIIYTPPAPAETPAPPAAPKPEPDDELLDLVCECGCNTAFRATAAEYIDHKSANTELISPTCPNIAATEGRVVAKYERFIVASRPARAAVREEAS